MKVCFFSPYVPKHVGGGEKYLFDAARLTAEMGEDVYVAIPGAISAALFTQIENHQEVRQKYEQFLNASLAKVKFISTPLRTSASFLTKLWWTHNFDVMYYATDGSLFFSLAKRNVLHIQVPFTDEKSSLLYQLKLANWQVKNTNSNFTKKVIEEHWRTEIDYVHFPVIAGAPATPKQINTKEKVILHVGRFFRQLHSKRQDVLVEIFKQLCKGHAKEMKGWKLVLVGSVEDDGYAAAVKHAAHGYPIEIIHEISRPQLEEWYTKAALYWHATGYEIDEMKEPAKVEHFGISTGEAMLAGCVPIVLGKGGQREVLGLPLHDLLWETMDECKEITLKAITSAEWRKDKAHQAVTQAMHFNEANFRATLREMVR